MIAMLNLNARRTQLTLIDSVALFLVTAVHLAIFAYLYRGPIETAISASCSLLDLKFVALVGALWICIFWGFRGGAGLASRDHRFAGSTPIFA